VESLDRSFPNVCELDLVSRLGYGIDIQIFNFPECHAILSEVISGSGLVLETDIDKIANAVEARKDRKRPTQARGGRTFGRMA
jgi:Clathrin adaptor complex small chain